MLAMIPLDQEKIAVVGLGYVGLPVALSFGRSLPTVGFDIRQKRVDDLLQGQDETREVTGDHLKAATLGACSAIMRALLSSVVPAGSPLISTIGLDHTATRGQPSQAAL